MKKNRKQVKDPDDFISEGDFLEQSGLNPIQPENDSPGDSESDAGSEFLMGLNYFPQKKFKRFKKSSKQKSGVPEIAKGLSSDLPEPWKDLYTDSDTH